MDYKLACGIDGFDTLRESVKLSYNTLKPYFKEECMKKHDNKKQPDIEIEDDDIRADRRLSLLSYFNVLVL